MLHNKESFFYAFYVIGNVFFKKFQDILNTFFFKTFFKMFQDISRRF
jgi:hypothetical protein